VAKTINWLRKLGITVNWSSNAVRSPARFLELGTPE
jgi:hypothetical protein